LSFRFRRTSVTVALVHQTYASRKRQNKQAHHGKPDDPDEEKQDLESQPWWGVARRIWWKLLSPLLVQPTQNWT